MLSGKVMTILLIAGLIKRIYLYISRDIIQKQIVVVKKIKVELDLSNDATKSEVRKARGVDKSEFARKVHLACMKSKVDKLDLDKLETVPSNLTILSNFVDNYVIEKADYNTKNKDIKLKIPNHDKLIATDNFNKFTQKSFYHRLKQSNLTTKDDVADFIKKSDFNEKL